MSNRLLSLLSEIEHAMKANDSNPDGGTWETLRIINFHQGLARLTLSVRSEAGLMATRGAILLQSYILADGTQCVKANLSWQGSDNTTVHAIYSKSGTNWHSEASLIANKWQDAYLTLAESRELAQSQSPSPMELPQGQSASPLEKATG